MKTTTLHRADSPTTAQNGPVGGSSLAACLVGGAVGDSIGLPFEGLSAGRIERLTGGHLRQGLVFGRGMVSDDTEHAVMTLLSLREAEGDADRFGRCLGRRLRWWFAGLPAGIGLGTARSILKLWLGFGPQRSGVASAGNGPMMRAAVIGCWFVDDAGRRREFVGRSTRVTHSDPRAEEGAQLVAEAAAMACGAAGNDEILDGLRPLVDSGEMRERFSLLEEALRKGGEVKSFADRFGRVPEKVSGFAPDTAAVAIYCWLKFRGNYQRCVEATVFAGGDTDTVAHIAGSLAGVDVGVDAIPVEWMRHLRDWPIDCERLREVAAGARLRFPSFPLSFGRNAVFFLIVLFHGFRRLFPPY